MSKVATGRIIEMGRSHGAPPTGSTVTAGSQWNTLVENSATSRMPVTNSGSPASARVMNCRVLSSTPPRQRADSIARPIDSGIMITAVTSTRKALLTTLSPISSATGRPLAAEMPGSPRSRSPSHIR